MRINILLPSIGTSGGMDVVYKYATMMVENGHDVVVYKEVFLPNLHRYTNFFKNKIHQIYQIMKAFLEAIKHANKIDSFVLNANDKNIRDADIIIATSWTTAYKVNKISLSKGKKYYFIQDYEIWDNEDLGNKTYALPLNKIVISTWINEQLKKNIGIGPFPVVYNGIDVEIFHALPCKKDLSKINFLMLNHVLPKKGVKNGLKAFERITIKHSNCVLRMFGMCDATNLPDYVEYHQNPSKEELVKLYSESDIFIFPSIEEGWGLTPIEAMACGAVVVGTRTGFVIDIGIHKKNMMISEPNDIQGMIENIEDLISNKEMMHRMSQEGIRTALKLSWNDSYNKLINILSRRNSI